jgi:hypothetical protein
MLRKKKVCKCGCGRDGYIWAKGMLKDCYNRLHPPKPIKKSALKQKLSPERSDKIKVDRDYYAKSIHANIVKNKGFCRCDECCERIRNPTGRNVAHLIGKGANLALYHDRRNHVILGKGDIYGECNCLWMLDESGEWEKMKLADHIKQVKQQLTNEYYNKKAP